MRIKKKNLDDFKGLSHQSLIAIASLYRLSLYVSRLAKVSVQIDWLLYLCWTTAEMQSSVLTLSAIIF